MISGFSKRTLVNVVKEPARRIRAVLHDRQIERRVAQLEMEDGPCNINSFNFEPFKERISEFLHSMRTDKSNVEYFFSAAASVPTVYASAYACMILGTLGEIKAISHHRKKEWITYFDSFQCPESGLFSDPEVKNEIFEKSDWWGARHLAAHMIGVYTHLGSRPRHPFRFLAKYYDHTYIEKWLESFNWKGVEIGADDLDNKLMNVGSLLQYQRDVWEDEKADRACDFIKRFLFDKINPRTGMWGDFDASDAKERSRMVQFTYHLFPLFFYDSHFDFDHEKIVQTTLKTQNKLGGFGVRLNSSACEDMDSIFILIKLSPYASTAVKSEINEALAAAFNWMLLNQEKDGGFVFRMKEPFFYGSVNTSAGVDQSAMMPTWFRLLGLAYLARYFDRPEHFTLVRCPGYEF